MSSECVEKMEWEDQPRGSETCGQSGDEEDLPIDRGWAWVVAFASIGPFAAVMGGYRSLGVIFVEALDHFEDANEDVLVYTFGVVVAVVLFCAPLATVMTERLSIRQTMMVGILMAAFGIGSSAFVPKAEYLAITLPVFFGVGASLLIPTSFMVTGPYFVKYQALALGITCSGSGFGLLVLTNILRVLFDTYGYQGGLLLYSGVYLNIFCLVVLLRPIEFYRREKDKVTNDITGYDEDDGDDNRKTPNLSSPSQKDNERESLNTEVAFEKPKNAICNSQRDNLDVAPKTSVFTSTMVAARSCGVWMVVILYLAISMGFGVVYLVIPRLAKENGVAKPMVAYLLTVSGCLEVIGRFLAGAIANKKWISPLAQGGLYMAATSAVLCVSVVFQSAIGTAMQAVVMGFLGSPVSTLQPLLIREEVDLDLVMAALGVTLSAQAVCVLIPLPIINAIVASTGSYRAPMLYIAGCFGFVAIYSGLWLTGKKLKTK